MFILYLVYVVDDIGQFVYGQPFCPLKESNWIAMHRVVFQSILLKIFASVSLRVDAFVSVLPSGVWYLDNVGRVERGGKYCLLFNFRKGLGRIGIKISLNGV